MTARRILGLVLLIVLVVAGVYAYKRWKGGDSLGNGNVTCVTGCDTPEEKAQFAKQNAGETADGNSDHKDLRNEHHADPLSGGGPQDVSNPVPGAATNQVPTRSGQLGADLKADLHNDEDRLRREEDRLRSRPTSEMNGAMPVSDSQGVNVTNGMRFGGTGTYSWYRQGNLTWRIDSSTGRTCIDFATLEEWRKQIVSSHGCGRNA